MKKEDLLKLITDDNMGLLDIKPKQSAVATADERLIASFEEINCQGQSKTLPLGRRKTSPLWFDC